MNYAILLHIMVFTGISLRVLLRDDLSPPARLAWIVVVIILPAFGTVIYVLFGEVELGKKAKQTRSDIAEDVRYRAERIGRAGDSVTSLIASPYQAPFHYVESINGFHPVSGNSAELMDDGMETRRRMVADIDGATKHVNVLYYIWLQDDTGTDLAQALIRAAKRGVECRAMADGLGSRVLIRSPLWASMKEAGVQMAVAMPLDNVLRTIVISRIDLRNHRKITVIDGRVTYCGSRNSADPEFRVKPKYAPWVDIMLRFQGPIVAQNQLLFASDWTNATGKSLDQFELTAAELQDNGFAAQAMGFGPEGRKGATPQMFATAIATAQKSVTLSTPYFVPDAVALEALCAAALRGIDVTLIFPKKNDSWIVAAASHSFYRILLDAGCRIYEFRDGLLHAKTMTIDDSISLIGSSNLDLRSFDLNYENNILLQDADITRAIQDRQHTYIKRSDLVYLADVTAWPYRRRIWNNAVATIGPIL